MPQTQPKHRLRRESASSGFVKILAGSLIGQVVSFFALPVLSRLYSPAEYGSFSLMMSVSALIAPLALFGMDQAVVRPKNDDEVMPQIAVGFGALTVISSLSAVCYYLWPVGHIGGDSTRAATAIALALLTWVGGASLLFNQLVIRNAQYGSLGIRNTIQSISITATQIALALLSFHLWINGLIIGSLVGTSTGFLILIGMCRELFRPVSWSECVASLRRDWRFPVVFAPANTLSQLCQQVPLLFVASWFGVSASGQVGMAERIVAVPVALLGFASSSVFAGELSHSVRTNDGRALSIYWKSSRMLFAIGAVVALGFAVLSPFVLPRFLGEEWRPVSVIAQIMSLVAASRILTTPTRGVFRVLGLARQLAVVELFRIACLGLAIGIVFILNSSFTPSLMLIYGAIVLSDLGLWALGLKAVKSKQ